MNRIRLKRRSLARIGIVGLGEDILGTPVFHISTVNRYTGKVGITYGKCSAASYNENYRANDFVREQARFYFCYSTGKGQYKPKYAQPPTVTHYSNS